MMLFIYALGCTFVMLADCGKGRDINGWRMALWPVRLAKWLWR